MQINTDKLKRILVEPGFIDEEVFNKAALKAESGGGSIAEILVEQDLISDENMGKLIAEELNYKFVLLKNEEIDQASLLILPEVVARSQNAIVFKSDPETLSVATSDPFNIKLFSLLEKKTGKKAEIYFASRRDIQEALVKYRKGIEEEFTDIIKENISKAESGEAELPAIKIVDTVLLYAYDNKASDVHIEPEEADIKVRFRIDGVLHDIINLPKKVHDAVVMRIKVLARLRTDEHRSAQDGKFRFKAGREKVDIRVSILPVVKGENVVLRLLSVQQRRFDLRSLGLSSGDYKKVNSALRKPHGMLLATGPTGSGKTTTLYAMLRILNKPDVNISTIEDPVEYSIEGISQTQVDARTNITFARGLRSILRQDPDIIMVGEVRDEETAGIAINAALTGHLVLSTLHTNDAATTLPRLLDMDIEPFLVATSVNIIVAQRLVRTICKKCITSMSIGSSYMDGLRARIPKERLTALGLDKKKAMFYHGQGCKVCGGGGFGERVGIFEVLVISDKIRKLTMERADAGRIKKQAIDEGMINMFEDGISKALQGVTTLDEVLRVTKE